MKLKGIFGKGSGKLGNAVFAVSGGEQLVKEYNPRVSNPNTPAQVEQRAKLKLLSQLAAALAPAIAIKKDGLVSARNQFISVNYPSVVYDQTKAEIENITIQLTKGSKSIPAIDVSAGENNTLVIELMQAAPAEVESMVYAVIGITSDLKMVVEKIAVVTEAGADRHFVANTTANAQRVVVLGYGVVASNGSLRSKYGDFGVMWSDEWTEVEVTQEVLASNGIMTKTQGAMVEFN